MQPATRSTRAASPRSVITAVPAVAGSIALVLSAAPAQATERPEEKSLTISVLHTLRAAASAPPTYTVQRGDTVSAIAARFGLRTVDVLAINGLTWSSLIYPGQVLELSAAPSPAPAPATPAPASGTHVVQRGDTVSGIAGRHGLSVQSVLAANGLGWSSIIYPGQKLTIPGTPVRAAATTPAAPAPSPAGRSYVVTAGDTVTAIAQRHGVTVNAVLAANGLGMSSIIYPGETLSIPATTGSVPASTSGLDAEQVDNARLIISIGRELGVSDRGIAIALGAAMQESWLRNLDWGDRDSLGLFQQRPSTGWGTAEQIRDRARSIRVFFGGPSDPNGSRTRGLLDIPGWQGMSFAQAAQAVQISAYPDRYARWETPAHAWLAALG